MRNHYIDRTEAENDVLACAAFIAERINSNDGHAQSLGLVIPRYLKRNDADLCAQLADELAENFSRDRLLLTIAEHCARNNDNEYAMQLADAIDDDQTRSDALERIAVVHTEQHEYDKAMAIADTLAHPEAVYSAAAFQYAKQGDDPAADEMAAKIDFSVLRAKTFAEIAADKIDEDKKSEAETWLDKAEAAAAESEHLEEKLGERIEIAGLWLKTGRNDRVIKLLSDARAEAENSNTRAWQDRVYSRIADYYYRAGSTDLSERTLDQIVDTYHFAACLRSIAAQKKEAGSDAEALDDLEEAIALLAAQRSTEIYDSAARNELLRLMSEDLAGLGRFERAMHTADLIEMPTTRDQAHINIAAKCAFRGEDDNARQALAAIEDEGSRSFAKISIGNAYGKNEEKEKAAQILNEAHDEAEDIQALPVRSDTFNELASAFHAIGDEEKADLAMRHNLLLIEQIRDPYYKVYMLTRAADRLVEMEAGLDEEEKGSLRRMSAAATQ